MEAKSHPGCRRPLTFALIIVAGIAPAMLALVLPHLKEAVTSPLAPASAALPPYTPWPTPPVADRFDYPLQPIKDYAAYAQGITGPRGIDTRYGAQNPALGHRDNCFRDRAGSPVAFSELHHAGVDLFARGPLGTFSWGAVAGAPVHAVGDGVVAAALDAGAEGQILITEHLLPDGGEVYAVYWHVSHLRVGLGQAVARGQVVAQVHDQGLNSHLHWEMRSFLDGGSLFPLETAGARGSCNGHLAGVAYTWDDVQERAHPDFYGYLDPMAFVAARRSSPPNGESTVGQDIE